MDTQLMRALREQGTDFQKVAEYFANNEKLYLDCLNIFITENSIGRIAASLHDADYEAAYAAAHTLKGNAAYLGFVPVFEASKDLLTKLRTGDLSSIAVSFDHLNAYYQNITKVIIDYLPLTK